MHTKGSAYAPNPYTGMSLCAPLLHRGGLIHPTLLRGSTHTPKPYTTQPLHRLQLAALMHSGQGPHWAIGPRKERRLIPTLWGGVSSNPTLPRSILEAGLRPAPQTQP